MAVRIAIASGNWNNTATWTDGIIPSVGDDVYSNNNIITIDVNVNVKSINNNSYSVVSAVPVMTSNTTPSGIATSNSGTPFHAFDGIGAEWINYSVTPGVWVAYEFPSPIVIDRYFYLGYTTNNNWNFEGWDGTNWIVLHTVTGASSPNNYTSPNIGNTTAYIKYRFVLNDTGYRRIHHVGMYEAGTFGSASGGGRFIINDGLTVAAETFRYDNANNVYTALFVHTGTGGTTTLTGNVLVAVQQRQFLSISGTGTFNFVGTLYGNSNNALPTLASSHTGTINITGDIYWVGAGGNSSLTSFTGANATINITGNVYDQGTTSSGAYNHVVINVSNATALNIVGNISNQTTMNDWTYPPYTVLSNSEATRTTIIGTLLNYARGACFASGSLFNFLTGPFVSSEYAWLPYSTRGIFIIPTPATYFEFVDNSTNGDVPPSVPIVKTRLVSADTPADAPIPANVRAGVVYANSNFTGTMAIPLPSAVASSIPVDNTVGTAVLDPSSIWAVPLTSINTLNSIGRRVKNAATVETTGAQIQQTLNNNE